MKDINGSYGVQGKLSEYLEVHVIQGETETNRVYHARFSNERDDRLMLLSQTSQREFPHSFEYGRAYEIGEIAGELETKMKGIKLSQSPLAGKNLSLKLNLNVENL